jgi:glucokinase
MDKEKQYAIGIDLGGTTIKYALVNDEGRTFFRGEIPSAANISATAVLHRLSEAAQRTLLYAVRRKVTVVGIGVGTPGIVDVAGRVVLGGAENISGWEGIDIAAHLEAQFPLPVRVANDANLMGLGEARYGAARGCSDVLFLTVGTGIGGAIIIDGKLFGGYANRGTELGHTPLIANGERCACGATGCLEHYASTAAMVRSFQRLTETEGQVDGRRIVRLYHEGFPPAVQSIKEHFYYLGRGIAGFINIFAPQRVVIGGGLSEAGRFYLTGVRRVVKAEVMKECAENTVIVRATLGNKAGIVGAGALFL